MKQVYLPDGSSMPQLGQGTWQMGEDDNKYEREIAGLRHGIELGMTLIDTAEMYADGKAENIAGNAAKPFARESLYICDKVYPKNADRKHIYSSVERSLKLLGTDYIDLYLLHWREDADLAEVAYCMEDLKDRGWIRRWGVSNFDVDDMEDLWKVPDGNKCTVNQVLYNLGTRGIEYDLLDWQREKGVPFIYLFARKFLIWGYHKPLIGPICRFCINKGEKGGRALEAKAGRGLTLALLLFVGIPLPGTGAWTGTLAGSILDMKFKDVLVACMGGVLLAGIIMGLASAGLLGALSGLFAVG